MEKMYTYSYKGRDVSQKPMTEAELSAHIQKHTGPGHNFPIDQYRVYELVPCKIVPTGISFERV